MNKNKRAALRGLMLGASVFSLSFGNLAFAQETAEADEAEETLKLDRVTVTVERRETTLQDLAGTAAVLSGDNIKALGLQNINDLDGKIPGVSIANNNGNIEVYIRGVGSSNNTELGDPAAATHLNGVYVPRPAGFGAAFFDIARVEVNIGPQGTLRGRNATAGSVNVIPWAPGIGVFDASIEAGYGNFNEVTVEGVVNVPVTSNSAFRLAGFYRTHDSRLTNISPDSSTLGVPVPTSEAEGIGVAEAADDLAFRAAYKIELTDRLDFTLTGDYIQQKGSGYTGVNFALPLAQGIDPEDIEDPRAVFGRGITPEEDTSHWGVVANLNYDGDWFNVEYIGSYRDLVYDYEFTTPASPFFEGALDLLGPLDFDNFNRIRFTTASESIVQELRLFSDDDAKLQWTAGGFFFKEDQRTFLGTTGDRNPFFQGVEFNQTTDTTSFSFYGDATYNVTDDFRLTGGIRYTRDEKERFGINARYAFGVGGPDFSCCFINGIAHGTEGFEFAGLDRTIINPDQNGDGVIDAPESIGFFFDGIAQFGARDGFDDVFPNGQQIQDVFPDPATRPQCDGSFAFVGSCNNFVPVFNGVIDFSLAPFNSTFALQNGRLENDFVDWRARVELDITEDNLFYFLVATGNKSGGFNDNIAGTDGLGISNPADNAPIEFDTDTLAPTYGPEQLTLYELGLKNEFFLGDIPVRFNASAFYYDYDDLQLTTLVSTAQVLDFTGLDVPQDVIDNNGLAGQIVGFTFNASDAEIAGAQFEWGLQLPADINVDATLLWLPVANIVNSLEIQDARFQADVDPANAVNRSIEGNRLIRTPEIQFNMNLSKAIQTSYGQFDGVVSIGYRSEQNMTIFNGIDFNNPNNPDPRLNDLVEGFATVDLGFGYTHGFSEKPWRIEGYVTNATNVQQPQAIIITQFDNTRFFNTPRLYGFRIRKRF